jgi:hypothetical protein
VRPAWFVRDEVDRALVCVSAVAVLRLRSRASTCTASSSIESRTDSLRGESYETPSNTSLVRVESHLIGNGYGAYQVGAAA